MHFCCDDATIGNTCDGGGKSLSGKLEVSIRVGQTRPKEDWLTMSCTEKLRMGQKKRVVSTQTGAMRESQGRESRVIFTALLSNWRKKFA